MMKRNLAILLVVALLLCPLSGMATEPLWGTINRICPHCGQEVEMSILWFTEEYNGQRSDRTH